ncbi:serine/threonine-protein kinase ATM isoform X2 [Morus notabilis]|uniref:serine/threonine-protein kinase ATM isoform X2 n=1 Tax=Morus notabilis TaxID=981085 RepID=UPI000CED6407|nr:serine/threonine-protein kinase ATM isoform X2 [Morus notabilis]XP_024025507.1 serine/threonine-protein kinase ATM isoform X2 [Morus notabilis]XP_024025508.1 serine/threonine-protein kinase ATM isoform X2 [Morus notabilis]XP_024025509.1 serine/threonine-protein kinase ATM isoform X2 [Morus notabilis]
MGPEFVQTSAINDLTSGRTIGNAKVQSGLFLLKAEGSPRGQTHSAGDIRDILHLRKSLLKAVLGHFNWQESSMFNEHLVLLLPAAVYSLSTGCAPFKQCHNRLPPFYAPQDVNGAMNDWVKAEELEQDYVHELFECSIEVLVNIDTESSVKPSKCTPSVAVERSPTA